MSTGAVGPSAGVAGFFGKLPIRGDFITRYLPRSFLDPWDAWLQQAIAHSRQQLRERWLDCYLTSPIWRFALSPGACGPAAFVGALIPSMDRVGRYYPLVIAAPLAGSPQLLALLENGQDWFRTAEQTALRALEEEWELEEFATRVAQLGLPQAPPEMDTPAVPDTSCTAWYCPLVDDPQAPESWPNLAEHLLRQGFPQYSLWWSQGSEQIAPCLLICRGLPPAGGFAALLAGDWTQHGWGERILHGQTRLFTTDAEREGGIG